MKCSQDRDLFLHYKPLPLELIVVLLLIDNFQTIQIDKIITITIIIETTITEDQTKEKSLLVSKPKVLYQKKKNKEEEKNTVVSIVDLLIIYSINVLLKIKINPLQAAPMLPILNQKLLQEEESLINLMLNSQFLNLLLMFLMFLPKLKFFSTVALISI